MKKFWFVMVVLFGAVLLTYGGQNVAGIKVGNKMRTDVKPVQQGDSQGGTPVIALKAGTEYNTVDGSGNFVLYGDVENTGTTPSVWPGATLTLYNAANAVLGTELILPSGSTNVRITAYECWAILMPGDTGHFSCTTAVSAASVDHWSYSFQSVDGSYSACQASVVLQGTPVGSNSGGNYRVSGRLTQLNPGFVASEARVSIALYNVSGQLIGLTSQEVNGDFREDPYGADSNAAIYPGQSFTFAKTTTVPYASVADVSYTPLWNEAAYEPRHYYMHGGVNSGNYFSGDFDGDGDTDIAIWRPSNGRWCIKGQASQAWGISTDIPVPGDYDGDGDTDIAIWRPSNGRWCIKGQPSQVYGVSTDIPVPGDYDGDGDTDVAIWRPSTGRWCIKGQASQAWGTSMDIPVPADYDGDGSTDLAVYRPSTGRWAIKGGGPSQLWGVVSDIPLPGDYDGDGDADIAVFRPRLGRWCIKGQASQAWGVATDIPVPGDYDGDGDMDITIFRPASGTWAIKGQASQRYGNSTDVPLVTHRIKNQ
ncbi:MAG: hypothetical protein GY765_02190 [bacterium]|nr:hypothetical protein [bacterium]